MVRMPTQNLLTTIAVTEVRLKAMGPYPGVIGNYTICDEQLRPLSPPGLCHSWSTRTHRIAAALIKSMEHDLAEAFDSSQREPVSMDIGGEAPVEWYGEGDGDDGATPFG